MGEGSLKSQEQKKGRACHSGPDHPWHPIQPSVTSYRNSLCVILSAWSDCWLLSISQSPPSLVPKRPHKYSWTKWCIRVSTRTFGEQSQPWDTRFLTLALSGSQLTSFCHLWEKAQAAILIQHNGSRSHVVYLGPPSYFLEYGVTESLLHFTCTKSSTSRLHAGRLVCKAGN